MKLVGVFAERFKKLRLEKDYTQQDIAKMLNIKYQSVGHWEKGSNEPNNDLLIALAELFNTSVDYLLGVEDKREKIVKAAHAIENEESDETKALIQEMRDSGMTIDEIKRNFEIAKYISKMPPVK